MEEINLDKYTSLLNKLKDEAEIQLKRVTERLELLQDEINPQISDNIEAWETKYPDDLGFDTPYYEEMNRIEVSIQHEIDYLEEIQYILQDFIDNKDNYEADFPTTNNNYMKNYYVKKDSFDLDISNDLISKYEENPILSFTTPEDLLKDNSDLKPQFKVVYTERGIEKLYGIYTAEEKAKKALNDWYIKDKNPQIVPINDVNDTDNNLN